MVGEGWKGGRLNGGWWMVDGVVARCEDGLTGLLNVSLAPWLTGLCSSLRAESVVGRVLGGEWQNQGERGGGGDARALTSCLHQKSHWGETIFDSFRCTSSPPVGDCCVHGAALLCVKAFMAARDCSAKTNMLVFIHAQNGGIAVCMPDN